MEFSVRRVNALFKKEVKDFGKNLNVLFMCFLPIVFTLIYSFMLRSSGEHISSLEILNLIISMNLVLTSSFVMASLISEEKEKNTMRTLMLSSVSPFEFLAGKALVILLISIINKTIMFLVLEFPPQYLAIYLALAILVVVTMTVLGGVIGLIAQNQMATGVVGMPILMIFMMIPLIGQGSKFFYNISLYLPNTNLHLLLTKILTGQSYTLLSKNFAIILAWIVISIGIFAYTYNKKGLDG